MVCADFSYRRWNRLYTSLGLDWITKKVWGRGLNIYNCILYESINEGQNRRRCVDDEDIIHMYCMYIHVLYNMRVMHDGKYPINILIALKVGSECEKYIHGSVV